MKCPSCQFENPDNTRFCGNCATPLQKPVNEAKNGTATFPAYFVHLVPGKVFGGRFQIIEEIGAGGMGRVYKALDLKVNENIALKLIHPEIAFRERNIERFRNELRLARKISHRNVCRMFDLHEAEGAVYITMEYVAGEDLRNSLRMMGPLTIGKAVSIARQVGEGLKEAHRLGIYHRDLKSRNIILDRDGNARIMDFGIASSLETKGLTDEGIAIGTPTYMSPEQSGGKGVDQRSDIYALGIIMYEMVTGDVPFRGDSALEIAMKHKLDLPKPPIDRNPRIPEPLNRLILKCLEKKKESRYQQVEDLLKDLKVIEEDLTTSEKPVLPRKIRATTIMSNIRTFKVPGYLVIGVAILLGLAYVIVKHFLPHDRQIRIAVLPFEYLGPEPNQDHIWRQLAPQISDKLHERYKDLIITPDRSAEFFAAQGKSNNEIGQKLDVGYLVSGKISIDQDQAGISFNLIDAEKDISLDRMNSKCGITEILDKEVGSIVDRVGKILGISPSMARSPMPQPDPDSLLFFAQGSYAERLHQETGEERYLREAEQHYLSALKIDPDYPMYHWLLGNLYESFYEASDQESDLKMMTGYFRRAYELDTDSAETNLGIGWVYFYQRDNDTAYTYFQRAFELDPNNFEVNYHIGGFLRSVGLFDKALKYYDLALVLNPGEIANPSLRTLPPGSAFDLRISCLISLGRFQEALNDLMAVRDTIPNDLPIRFYMTHLYICMKMYQEAERELAEIIKLDDSNPRIPFYQSLLYAANGDSEKALEPIRGGFDSRAFYLVTQIYCALGMKSEAIQSIQDGIETGFSSIQTYMYPYQYLINNPNYALLRTEPAYQEIVRTQKKIYDRMVEMYRDL
jgi:serine/threonine protein kinase/tetratricopeptide (TPR) repeat protein